VKNGLLLGFLWILQHCGTPSLVQGTIHSIEPSSDVIEDDPVVSDQMIRSLCTTSVMNIYKDPINVLQHLCSALLLMSKTHMHHTSNLSRCLSKFHKGVPSVTYHHMSYDEVVNFYVLTNTFMRNRKIHKDVRWRNIGKYKNGRGVTSLVLFDLVSDVDYVEGVDDDVISKAASSLYL